MTDQEAKKLIEQYEMLPHEEGGYYRELWRKPADADGACIVSHIYYLLRKGEQTRWHRITSDEIWLFHHGAPVTLYLGGNDDTPNAAPEITVIGNGLYHCRIPANTWQMAAAGDEAVLTSCIVSPGFEYEGWELLEE